MRSIITLLTSFMVICGLSYDLNVIKIQYGILEINDGMYCDIIENNVVIKNVTGVLPGLHYGLITYNCNGTSGTIISKFECAICGMYCDQNEVLENCKHKNMPIIYSLGILTGILLCIITVYIYYKFINKKLSKFITSLKVGFYKRKENKTIKIQSFNDSVIKVPTFKNLTNKERARLRSDRLNRITYYKNKSFNSRFVCIDDDIYVDPNVARTIHNKNIEPTMISRDLIGNKNLNKNDYELVIDGDIATAPSDIGSSSNSLNYTKPPVPPRTERTRNLTIPSRLIMGAAIASTLINGGNACNFNFYFRSNGEFCNNEVCKPISTTSLKLMAGQSICIRDAAGEIMKIDIEKLDLITKYALIYKTSDYEVKVTDVNIRCLGAGNCWRHQCNFNTGIFKTRNDSIQYSGCLTDVVHCGYGCSYSVQCYFYRWILNKKGPIYNVYKKISSIWAFEMKINYNNITTINEFTSTSPTTRLELVDIMDMGIPILAYPVTYEIVHTDNFLISGENGHYSTDANELGMTLRNRIGDYQISIEDDSESFDMDSVDCIASSCTTVCKSEHSALYRFLKHRPYRVHSVRQYSMGTKNLMSRIDIVPAVFEITIGNFDAQALIIKDSNCIMKLIMSYGCTGCNERPYIIINTFNIKQSGLMKVDTDCPMDIHAVPCNGEPTAIYMTSIITNCTIYSLITNQTLDVAIDYEFVGKLYNLNKRYDQAGFTDAFLSLVKNKSFISTLFETFMIGIFISTVTSVVFKIVRYCGAIATANTIQNNSANIDSNNIDEDEKKRCWNNIPILRRLM